MALLFSLNRLEILPCLEELLSQKQLLICNRGPYANLFNVARRVLEDGVDWNELPASEKKRRIDIILELDREFLGILGKDRKIIHVFLHLDPKESMKLAKQRAADLLDAEPDEHERSESIQQLTAQIYREIAEGKIEGHQAELVEATKGSSRRQWETPLAQESMTELEGILATAKEVSRVVFPYLMVSEWQSAALSSYAREIHLYALDLWRTGKRGGTVNFEFREILELGDGSSLGLELTRPKLMAQVLGRRPGVREAIEASRRLDEELVRSKEWAFLVSKERL